MRGLLKGAAIARLLRGAWRVHPTGVAVAQDVDLATERLIALGAGPLAWWQLRDGPLAATAGGHALRAAYQLQVLQSVRAQPSVAALAALVQGAGLRALLVKGLAVAERYPHPGLRPYGDNDLWVAPEDAAAMRAQLAACAQPLYVDLHTRVDGFEDRPFAELWARSVPLSSAGTEGLRTLAPEDHLRLLVLHLLRHGASRPTWLCDVALLMEAAAAGFDWDLCVGDDEPAREWLGCVLGLCVHLLGAHPGSAPWREPPDWLCDAVLAAWGAGLGEPLYALDRRMLRLWRQPAKLWQGLRQRWPNAVQVAMELEVLPHARMPQLAGPRAILRRGRKWLAFCVQTAAEPESG